MSALDGALLIDKPEQMTSAETVSVVKRTLIVRHGLEPKARVGHCGTLDPFAAGLLVVMVGRATKLSRYFLTSEKTYRCTLEFGKTTDTGDCTGASVNETQTIPKNLDALKEAAASFLENIYYQTPPMYSAKKHRGKRLYQLARKGITIEREPVPCHVYRFDILGYAPPHAEVMVSVSSGTYVRTLAEDFAKKLGTQAFLSQLTRVASGPLKVERAIPPIELERKQIIQEGANQLDSSSFWIPMDQVLTHLPSYQARAEECDHLFVGQQEGIKRSLALTQYDGDDPMVVYQGNQLVAVAKKVGYRWDIEQVFVPSQSMT